jgi:hypothetical protein
MIKLRRVQWAGHVARMGDMRIVCTVFRSENQNGRHRLENVEVNRS